MCFEQLSFSGVMVWVFNVMTLIAIAMLSALRVLLTWYTYAIDLMLLVTIRARADQVVERLSVRRRCTTHRVIRLTIRIPTTRRIQLNRS